MKLHQRVQFTQRAHLRIAEAVIDAVKEYSLTTAELVSILSMEIASWVKYEIRDERNSFVLRQSDDCADSDPLPRELHVGGIDEEAAKELAKRLDNYGPWTVSVE